MSAGREVQVAFAPLRGAHRGASVVAASGAKWTDRPIGAEAIFAAVIRAADSRVATPPGTNRRFDRTRRERMTTPEGNRVADNLIHDSGCVIGAEWGLACQREKMSATTVEITF